MKISPILYSTPMIQAKKDKRKTVTRRLIDPQPITLSKLSPLGTVVWQLPAIPGKRGAIVGEESIFASHLINPAFKLCRYGYRGDILWARESVYTEEGWGGGEYAYKADGEPYATPVRWKPSSHMPKNACRFFDRIVSLHAERLHAITPEDCIKEGIEEVNKRPHYGPFYMLYNNEEPGLTCDPVQSYRSLWININGLESWESNPWVWRIETESIDMPENFLTK